MREWLRDHGLLIANLALFLIFFGGMILSGVRVYNSDQLEHGQQAVSLGGYLLSGAFFEATFENWESEFLQMGMYVVLTAFLFQKGSSESKPVDEAAPQHEDPRQAAKRPGVPWPVRRGGWVLTAYEHSLSALFFILSSHRSSGMPSPPRNTAIKSCSMVIVFASVYLRQRGSPESKPVAEPHRDTGS